MTMNSCLRFVALAGLLFSSAGFLPVFCQAAHTAPKGQPFAVIAYVNGAMSEVDKYRVEELTHINYSFLHLRGNTLGLRPNRDSAGIAHLVSLKSRNPRLKVILSVGGWGGCETCSEVFSTNQGRKEFAESARGLLERFRADGIDLDWEYPAIEGYPGHRFSPGDRRNFTLLVKELRTVLTDKYELSFAAGGLQDFLEHSVEWDQVAPLVDRINLMTYDLVNGNSTRTGHHTPLFSTTGQRESADYDVRFLDSLGVPRRKIIIGAAFYARVWGDVGEANNGLYQPGQFKAYVRYRDFDKTFGNDVESGSRWDSLAQAPYRYDSTKKLFATFDNQRSIRLKTGYALKNGMGGIMFWELSGDKYEGGLLDAIGNALRQGGRGR
jgi:chitinase